jgi:flavin-dependent dehydrogenase
MERFDLAVVGAGPAGLAAASTAGAAGLSCVVVERRTPPLDKACGEGLMPAGVRLLAELGVALPDGGHSPFVGIRYLDGELRAEGRFHGGAGRGVRRTVLVEAMAERARQLRVDLRYGCEVHELSQSVDAVIVGTSSGALAARWLVAADGLHSPIRRRLGLAAAPSHLRRFGIRRHYVVRPWSELVEVYWADGVEAYVTPVGHEVGVALLSWRDGRGFDDLLTAFPLLRERLQHATVAGKERGAGPLLQPVRRVVAGRVVLFGDAAGYIDAITGEGLTLALRSARQLVDVLVRGAGLGEYERRYRALWREHVLLTRLLLSLSARPWLRRRVIRALAERPALFSWILEQNGG